MDIRIPLRSADEEAPVITVEVCDPFYADAMVFDESTSEWVLVFEGDADDMRTCSDSSRNPNITKLKIRGRLVDHPFRFVTATPIP